LIEIDDSEFPLLVVVFKDSFGPEEWHELTARQERYYAEGLKFAMVVDTISLSLPDLALLKEIGAWVQANESNMRTYIVGTALHIPSAVVRGALKFVNQISPPPSPQVTAKSLSEAKAWARERLKEAL
jgi:hypothetical protein